jgi:hypothetical protein
MPSLPSDVMPYLVFFYGFFRWTFNTDCESQEMLSSSQRETRKRQECRLSEILLGFRVLRHKLSTCLLLFGPEYLSSHVYSKTLCVQISSQER